ncbi:MAG TPA: macro domain-containing protein [Roseiflexaceae bacterium]|nr:macro domain-containing protein [Roseiflexaceae bacterium]
MAVSLLFCDRSPDMVNAWRNVFPEESGVRVFNQNILTIPADALAVPANSFGFTDGGVDLAISREVFDWGLQDRLRDTIARQYRGELLVGQALVMPTGSQRLRYVVVAPTMRVPEDISATTNVYLATRAILLACDEHNRAAKDVNEQIRSVAIPGLGAGVGKMPPERVAFQMWNAYRVLVQGDTEWTTSLEKQSAQHRKMLTR